jgi:hypothetical protein
MLSWPSPFRLARLRQPIVPPERDSIGVPDGGAGFNALGLLDLDDLLQKEEIEREFYLTTE